MAVKSRLGVSLSQPFFMFQGNNIFSFDDTPHLLKYSRNCLLNNDIVASTGTAKWVHIVHFYENDRKQKCRLAPKLTERHFNMQPFGSKMKVSRACQIFSHSVAAGIATYANFGRLSTEAHGTSAFLDWMNNLFDTLNSGRIQGKHTIHFPTFSFFF